VNKNILPDWQVQSFLAVNSHRTAVRTLELASPKKIVGFQNTGSLRSRAKCCFTSGLYGANIDIDVTITSVALTTKIKFSIPWEIIKELHSSSPKNMLGAWNMIPSVSHEFSCKEFVCRSSLFTAKKQTKKSDNLSHFSNLKFLLLTAGVLNSAHFDSISFLGKFEINFYHRFRWYATLENKTPAEAFPKFLSLLRVIDRSNRNPPITATSVIFWPSLRHASGL